MKILFVNQFFWPDSSATSQLLTDLACGLVERGHEVTVLCADGSYAPSAVGEPPPVRIERVKALPFVRGRTGRMLSYLSFYVLALSRAFSMSRQDIVVSLTTPPLISLVGAMVKMARGSQHFIWEMDMYPDVAVDLQYLKAGGLVERITGALADFARRRADGILALGPCMKERLIARGVNAAKISVAENWADSRAIEPLVRQGAGEQVVLLYSGNLGLAHDLQTIVGAIRNLRDDSRFRFAFVGGGSGRTELAQFCRREEIHSVDLLPYVAREKLSEGLSIGDIGVVTQRDVCCGAVVPSKVYGILAAGRPILFIGPRTATPALTIAEFQCGWQVDCGAVEELTALLLRLAAHPEEMLAAGQRARQALLDRYDLPIGVDRIANILEANYVRSCAGKSKPEVLGPNDHERIEAASMHASGSMQGDI